MPAQPSSAPATGTLRLLALRPDARHGRWFCHWARPWPVRFLPRVPAGSAEPGQWPCSSAAGPGPACAAHAWGREPAIRRGTAGPVANTLHDVVVL